VGIITSLILPSEALWRRVAYEVQSPLVASMGFSPFVARSVPSPLMIYYAVFFLVIILLLAINQFYKRDL
jgi:Cu-processing system permease protein